MSFTRRRKPKFLKYCCPTKCLKPLLGLSDLTPTLYLIRPPDGGHLLQGEKSRNGSNGEGAKPLPVKGFIKFENF